MTEQKNAPTAKSNQGTAQTQKTPAHCNAPAPKFTPRELRAIHTLLARQSVERVELDSILHSTNCADTVMRLRRKLGQDSIQTELHSVTNVFGEKSQSGRYSLTPAGRARLAQMGVLQ